MEFQVRGEFQFKHWQLIGQPPEKIVILVHEFVSIFDRWCESYLFIREAKAKCLLVNLIKEVCDVGVKKKSCLRNRRPVVENLSGREVGFSKND